MKVRDFLLPHDNKRNRRPHVLLGEVPLLGLGTESKSSAHCPAPRDAVVMPTPKAGLEPPFLQGPHALCLPSQVALGLDALGYGFVLGSAFLFLICELISRLRL